MHQGEQHDRHEPHDHHGHGDGHGHQHPDETGLADLLDLDAEVLGSYLGEALEWAARCLPQPPRTVVDVGAGTGSGSLALARHFGSAEVVAVDRSAEMLERLDAKARRDGLRSRLRLVEADLETAWPSVDDVDLVWASSSLHEVADPDRLLRDVHSALRPDGLLVVVEAGFPLLLPADDELGRPGWEARCHEALAEAGWNGYPDWTSSLEGAGFELVERRTFSEAADATLPATRTYAYASLRHMRTGLEGRLPPEDLEVVDLLLDAEDRRGVLRRQDLSVRRTRTAWAASPS
ncbi:MAG: class I SAM-dependent methyltransferase [Actinomycetes bacterium]